MLFRLENSNKINIKHNCLIKDLHAAYFRKLYKFKAVI